MAFLQNMMTSTFLGKKVDIPNCAECGNWLGKHNCKDDEVIYSRGAQIMKIGCNHFYHGNCCKANKDDLYNRFKLKFVIKDAYIGRQRKCIKIHDRHNFRLCKFLH